VRVGAIPFLLICVSAYGQRSSENALRVTVTARDAAAIAGQGAKLHWVIDPLPGAADVLVTNEKLRQEMAAALAGVKARKPNCLVWYTEKNPADCSLPLVLTQMLAERLSGVDFSIDGPKKVLLSAPAAGATESVSLKGSYRPVGTVVKSLKITVSTANSEAGSASEARLCAAVDAALEFPVAGVGSDTVPIRRQYADADLDKGGGGRFDAETICGQLLGVAEAAYKEARAADLLPKAKSPESRRGAAEQHVEAIYTIHHSDWPAVTAQYGGNGDYEFAITHLHIVKSARMKLTQGSLVAYNDAALQRKLGIAEARVQEKFAGDLGRFSGVIPTDESVWKAASEIVRVKPPEITGPVVPKRGVKPGPRNGVVSHGVAIRRPEAEDVLWFTAEHRWLMSTIEDKGDLAITANPHELISGQTQFSEENLLGFIHTSAATLKAGPEVQRGDFDFDITRTKQQITFGFHLNGQYLRDENQKFGYLAGPKFTDEEWGPTPKAFVEWAPSRGRFSSGTRVELPFQFHHFNIHPPAGIVLSQSRGWVNGPAPTFHQFLAYDLTRLDADQKPVGHLGSVNLGLDAGMLRAGPAMNSDFDFERYSATVRVQGFAGITGPEDFLIRYARGIGMGSRAMPLFELFQLGGNNSVRGIEQGEFVGRGIAFDQSEVGVNTASVWRWVSRKQGQPKPAVVPAGSAAAAPAPSLSKLGISSIFVVGFYDRGRVAQASSLGELLDLQHALHGYGCKAELRGLRAGTRMGNLSIGYARSPGSVLHSKGVFITAFSLEF
jgi:hypothetical protein